MFDSNSNNPFKHILVYLGITLVLVGASAVKGEASAAFFLGLALLVAQLCELPGLLPQKRAVAEIILSVTLGVSAVTQLVLAKSFNTPQAYMVVLLIGVVLILVDAIRRLGESV